MMGKRSPPPHSRPAHLVGCWDPISEGLRVLSDKKNLTHHMYPKMIGAPCRLF